LDSTTRELVKGHIEKANQKLAVARRLLDSGDYDDSVSRAYYAAFHGARALLVSAGQSPSTHQGVVTLFHLLFVKTGRIAREMAKCLTNLKDDRESVDYELFADYDEKDARNAVSEAERFVSVATEELRRESLLD
jgi:uncharacterized protein